MENNSLIEKKEYSFIDKIKNFFRKIFGKQNKVIVEDKLLNVEKTSEYTNNFKASLSDSTNIEEMKKNSKILEIIDIIEKEPKTLKKLSMDKLEVIDNYYVDRIFEIDKKINTLKRKLA